MTDDLIDWFKEADGFRGGTKAPHKWVLQAHSEIILLRARLEKLEAEMKWADEISNIQAARLEELEAKLATARRDAFEEAAQTVLSEGYHLYNEKPRVPEALMEAADAIRAGCPPRRTERTER